ncbi:MAG: DNA-binding protein WhiA [Clostridia bacterium]|nr:DNA-binding protein WhiA [Clostridia bacterium]
MSFSSDVRNEILQFWQKKNCCKTTEIYGILLFGHKFSDNEIKIKTDNEELASHCRSIIKKVFDIVCDITESKGVYTVSIDKLHISDVKSKLGESNAINLSLLKCDNCFNAFLRGAFLSCGVISDPEKEYHLEFVVKNEGLAWELCKMIRTKGLDAKIIERRGKFVVYLKDSENIEDLLTMMNATNASLFIMNQKIIKQLRNNVNRITNFETANLQKSAQSAAKHIEAIEKLDKAGLLSTLPDELYKAAIARRDNFDLSLSELGKTLGLSRAGIYHRLDKIVKLASKI